MGLWELTSDYYDASLECFPRGLADGWIQRDGYFSDGSAVVRNGIRVRAGSGGGNLLVGGHGLGRRW